MKPIDLLKAENIEVRENCDLTQFSTMKLVAYGDLIIAKSKEELVKIAQIFFQCQAFYTILGKGSNFLLKSSGLVLFLSNPCFINLSLSH